MVEKENAVRSLEGGVKVLETERNGLLKIRREQEKALHFQRNNDGYNEKIEKSRSQLSKLKEECKVLTLKTAENEKQLLKTHGKTVGKNKRIKEVEERIRENREKLRKGTQHVVTVEMISEIEEEIMKLETEFKELQKSWQEKISNVEVEYSNRRIEEEKKLIVLKDKERESKLNEIRLKEFRKLIIQSRS